MSRASRGGGLDAAPSRRAALRLTETGGAMSDTAPGGPFAGAITAALFLRRFAPKARRHVHFDLYGWSPATKPGRPEGGEGKAARLVHEILAARYPAV